MALNGSRIRFQSAADPFFVSIRGMQSALTADHNMEAWLDLQIPMQADHGRERERESARNSASEEISFSPPALVAF